MNYDDIDFFEEEFEEELSRDKKVDEAKIDLLKFFEEHKEEAFYLKQMTIFFEKFYFHWITTKAVSELIEERSLGAYRVTFGRGMKLKFVFHRSYRYYKRQVENKAKLVAEYSAPHITRAIGELADVLFSYAFTKKGFKIEGEDANEFRGKKWKKTDHNLDLIISKDNVTYGVEIKNTLEYIKKDELDIKLDICEYLGIDPLFIMRFAPKSYNYEIIERGGFALIFEEQIYPLGQEPLVDKIKETLNLPVTCTKAIPIGIINRFINWHDKHVNSILKSHKGK